MAITKKSSVSIPEKREIPFEEEAMQEEAERIEAVSIPEKREIPFEEGAHGTVYGLKKCFNP